MDLDLIGGIGMLIFAVLSKFCPKVRRWFGRWSYVVDTSIINKLADGKIDPSELPTDGEFITSLIQIDEVR